MFRFLIDILLASAYNLHEQRAQEEDWMSFAEKVRVKREEKRLTQGELAKKAKLTQATISRIEHGEVKQLKSDALKNLARALGVTVDFLVGDQPKMTFEDAVKADDTAKVVFRGYERLSPEQREQVKDYVEFLVSQSKPKQK